MSTRRSMLMTTAIPLTIAIHAAPASARKSAKKLGLGMRPSLANSLEAKRESQTVIDVLAVEDVVNFPDESVAETLRRSSGVSISREFGRSEHLSAHIRQDSASPI